MRAVSGTTTELRLTGLSIVRVFYSSEKVGICVLSIASWCALGLENGSKYTVETFVLAELERLQQLPPDQWNTIKSFMGKEKEDLGLDKNLTIS